LAVNIVRLIGVVLLAEREGSLVGVEVYQFSIDEGDLDGVGAQIMAIFVDSVAAEVVHVHVDWDKLGEQPLDDGNVFPVLTLSHICF
jgi:hypothetical protein